MLETLLKHLDTAATATTNGSAEAPAAEKTTEEPKKDEVAAPAGEVSWRRLLWFRGFGGVLLLGTFLPLDGV